MSVTCSCTIFCTVLNVTIGQCTEISRYTVPKTAYRMHLGPSPFDSAPQTPPDTKFSVLGELPLQRIMLSLFNFQCGLHLILQETDSRSFVNLWTWNIKKWLPNPPPRARISASANTLIWEQIWALASHAISNSPPPHSATVRFNRTRQIC